MLSLGTEFFFAFWMASYSVGLPDGSPPPTRAATSTFLINRAKFLPRRASMTAFLCLVVAHLEWPLMPSCLTVTGEKFACRVYGFRHEAPEPCTVPPGRNLRIADQARPVTMSTNSR